MVVVALRVRSNKTLLDQGSAHKPINIIKNTRPLRSFPHLSRQFQLLRGALPKKGLVDVLSENFNSGRSGVSGPSRPFPELPAQTQKLETLEVRSLRNVSRSKELVKGIPLSWIDNNLLKTLLLGKLKELGVRIVRVILEF